MRYRGLFFWFSIEIGATFLFDLYNCYSFPGQPRLPDNFFPWMYCFSDRPYRWFTEGYRFVPLFKRDGFFISLLFYLNFSIDLIHFWICMRYIYPFQQLVLE